MNIGRRAFAVVCVAHALFFSGQAAAVPPLKPGDILVTENFHDALFQIDPFAGSVYTLSIGQYMRFPTGVALGPGNEVYVVDEQGINDYALVLHVDVSTGIQTAIATLPVDHAGDIVMGADGMLYVPGYNDPSEATPRVGVWRVDPATGATFQYSGMGHLERPAGVDAAPNGDIYIADTTSLVGALHRLTPSSGKLSTVSIRRNFIRPNDAAVLNSGDIAVFDTSIYGTYNPNLVASGGVILVDPTQPLTIPGYPPQPGNQMPWAFRGNFFRPGAMARNFANDLVIADVGILFRVDTSLAPNQLGNNQQVIFKSPVLNTPTGMAIVPGLRKPPILEPTFVEPTWPKIGSADGM